MSPFLIILVVALVTALIRLLPVYLLGRKDQHLPEPVLFLTRAMPSAIIGLLVVFSLKGVTLSAYPYGIPALAGVLTAALLQYFKKNTLLSVFCATALYMLLLRVM